MMIRRGRYKYTTSLVDPPQLFDLATDPLELRNLVYSTKELYARTAAAFAQEADRKWDLQRIHTETLTSQRQRRLCWNALTQGRFESWDYQPGNDSAQK